MVHRHQPCEMPVSAIDSGRRVRVALVGCGRIARQHVEAIDANHAHAELVALCDNDPRALAAVLPDVPLRRHASLDLLLEHRKDIDLVVLATPSGLHPAQATQVARAGLHVMTEKPMGTRWDEAHAMVKACEDAGVKLFVVKQNRLNPTLVRLKRAVDEGRFGRIAMATVNVFWTRPQSYYDAAPWRGTWALDGGAFLNQASHYVDMLDWLLGPVSEVHAWTATLARRIEAEDTGVMSLRLASGGLATINVTMLTHARNFEGSITVLGEEGTVRIGGVAVNRVDHWQFARSQPDDASIAQTSYDTASVYGRGHAAFYAQALAALRGEASGVVEGIEGLRSLEVVLAAYRSAREGRAVRLPLTADVRPLASSGSA